QRVPMVRSGDRDRVDSALADQVAQIFEILRLLGAAAGESGYRLFARGLIDVTDRNDVGDLRKATHMTSAAAPQADDAHVDFFVRAPDAPCRRGRDRAHKEPASSCLTHVVYSCPGSLYITSIAATARTVG